MFFHGAGDLPFQMHTHDGDVKESAADFAPIFEFVGSVFFLTHLVYFMVPLYKALNSHHGPTLFRFYGNTL